MKTTRIISFVLKILLCEETDKKILAVSGNKIEATKNKSFISLAAYGWFEVFFSSKAELS